MKVTVREFDPDTDLAEVLAIGSRTPEFAAGDRVLFWTGEALASWRRCHGGPMLVAVDSHTKMVGFLLATTHDTGIATLENIVVVERARRRGVASKLLDEFEGRSRLAGASVLRSLGHASNAAISHLLAGRGYVDAVQVHWCSGAPQAMTRRQAQPAPAVLELRPLAPREVDRTWLVNSCDEGLASGLACLDRTSATARLLARADVLLGAFSGGRLSGLVATSIHEPTRKATIESVLTDRGREGASLVATLVSATLPVLADRGITYVAAHPSVEKTALVEHLIAAGFAKLREFQLRSKAC